MPGGRTRHSCHSHCHHPVSRPHNVLGTPRLTRDERLEIGGLIRGVHMAQSVLVYCLLAVSVLFVFVVFAKWAFPEL